MSQLRSFRMPRSLALLIAFAAAMLVVGSASASSYAITLDGTKVSAVTTTGGEKVALSFSGTAGHRVSVRVWSSTVSGYTVSLKDSSGNVLKSGGSWGVAGGFFGPVNLPTSGTYKIFITPGSTAKGKWVVSAWDVPADVTSTIATDGTTTTQTYTAPGQNGTMTFSATAGQRVSLLAGQGATTARNVSVSIKAPGGATVLASTAVGTGGMFFDPMTLPVDGTYTITVNPPTYTTGSTDFQLWLVGADQTGTLTIGGGSQAYTFNAPGQNANLTFSGTLGQKVTLSALASLTGKNAATVTIRRPDTTLLTTINLTNAGSLMEPTTLPATGTYTVKVDPTAQAVGTITLNLFLSPADLSGTLTSEIPVTLALGSAGQNASYTITGTTGQYLALRFANDTIASTAVSVKTPSNTTLVAATTFGTGGKFFDAVVLPASGTYTIKVDPQSVSTGSVDMTGYVFTNPTPFSATLGTSLPVGPTIPGQNVQISFVAAAKDSILFNNTTLGSTSITGVTATLTQNGTTIKSWTFGNADYYVDTMNLTAGLTYKLLIDPSGKNSGTITTTIYNVPADAPFSGTVGGSATAVSNATPGQNAKLTFTGTASHSLSIWFDSNTIGNPIFNPTLAKLTSPTGTVVTTFNLYAHDTFIEPVVLPATGTYTLSFDPNGSYIGSFNATLYDVPADATATATVNSGLTVDAQTTVPGQNAQVSFTTTSNAQVTITYDLASCGSCAGTQISILKNGVVVQSAQSRTPGDSWTFTPASGTNTYVVKIDPITNVVGDQYIGVTSP
jgi:hypothetical protein